jgi:hypothetical protein
MPADAEWPIKMCAGCSTEPRRYQKVAWIGAYDVDCDSCGRYRIDWITDALRPLPPMARDQLRAAAKECNARGFRYWVGRETQTLRLEDE